MRRPISVGLIGLGTIAETHLAVLAEIPDVTLSFVADIDPGQSVSFRGSPPPHYPDVTSALRDHQPDLVVITTPTRTHAEITTQVLTQSTAQVLVEKPLVRDLQTLATLQALAPAHDLRARVAVAHHFAFSPEVQWAATQIERHSEWGPVTRLISVFHDPYIAEAEHSFAAYESAWIDSGINQLSMLTRFVDPVHTHDLHQTGRGESAWCNVDFHSKGTTGTGLLRTSWQAAASSKHTTLVLGHSGVEMRLDHTAVTAVTTQDDRLLDTLTNDGHTPRKLAHYRPLYQSLLSDTPHSALSYDTATHLVQLLHQASAGLAQP